MTSNACNDKNAKIAIIGAGAAGLSAAYELKKLGYDNVTIYEKQDRVGGQGKSLVVNGKQYELGTLVVGIPYESINDLIKHTRLELAPLDTIKLVDLDSKKYVMSRNLLYFKNLGAIIKCLIFNRQLRKYLSNPSYAGVNDTDLFLNFHNWALKHKVEKIKPLIASLYVGWGYGYLEEVPAVYIFKLMNLYLKAGWHVLTNLGNLKMKYIVKGYQALWEKIAEPFDVRLSSNITKIVRDDKVHITNNNEIESYDKIIIACPLDSSLNFIDASDNEKKLFSKIKNVEFYSCAISVRNIPDYNLTFVYNYLTPPRKGRALSWYKRWEDDNLCVFYIIGDKTTSQIDMEKMLQEDLSKIGAEIEKVHCFEKWKYFPHVSSDDLAEGFYDKIEDMQGDNNTYYVGEIMSFSTVEQTSAYARDLVKKFFS